MQSASARQSEKRESPIMLHSSSRYNLRFHRTWIVHLPFSLPQTIRKNPHIAVKRGIITESHEPWIVDENRNPVREKVYHVVLVEQQLPYLLHHHYKTHLPSWKQYFSDYFPQRGVHFKYSYIPAPVESKEQHYKEHLFFSHVMDSLTHDLTQTEGSIPISTVLVTRGPIMSLAAQYYLESWPLAGLVMVDPLLLPPPFLTETASRLLILKQHTLIDATLQWQMELLHQLRDGRYNRNLKLEPGSVPMGIFSTSISTTLPPSDDISNKTRQSPRSHVNDASNQTATRHSDSDHTVTVYEIREEMSKLPNDSNIQEDINEMLETIFRFCEDKI